jgi:uncharacterized protein YvpB
MAYLPSKALHFVAILGLAAILSGVPGLASARANAVLLTGFPRLKQQHALTCESSAASMATRGVVSESQIMALMPRHPNPNKGFRGNPDGKQGTSLVDYGVYATPVQKALTQLGYHSDTVIAASDTQIMTYIARGWPVVVWVSYALQKATPRLAQYQGVSFVLVPHEHTVLAVGYNDQSIIANDPWTGKQVTYKWWKFNRSWGYFGDMALAVQPCPLPPAVSGLFAGSPSTGTVTWTWQPEAQATRYRIKVTQVGVTNRVVYKGVLTTHQFTLASALPGTVYDIAVTAISPCGATSTVARLGFQTAGSPPPVATPSGTPTSLTPAVPEPTSARS